MNDNRSQQSLINFLPFSPLVIRDLTEIGGGNVQQTFISKNFGVIHTIPMEDIKDPHISLISNRWVMRNKPQLLAEVQRLAPVTDKVFAPQIKAFGTFNVVDQVYSFWSEDYIPGETLLDLSFKADLYCDFEDLLIWLARLHQETQSNMSLMTYYIDRLRSLQEIFSLDSPLTSIVGTEFSLLVLSILGELVDSLDSIIATREKVSIIHGDMRSSNIIFNSDRKAVIDFEQGVNGGDWFCDLEKLLMLTNMQLPSIDKPYTYRPPLTPVQKIQLVKKYIELRDSGGWLPPQIIQEYESGKLSTAFYGREKLFGVDNDLSQLVYTFMRGWTFYTRPGQFHEQKGVLYLRDRFIRNYLS